MAEAWEAKNAGHNGQSGQLPCPPQSASPPDIYSCQTPHGPP